MGPALERSVGVRESCHRLMRPRRWLRLAAIAVLSVGFSASAHADDASGNGVTPPRMSLVDGEVGFWRPGADDWEAAQVNTPLAAGDRLRSGTDGRFEIQVGRAAFVRGAADTQVALETRDGAAVKLGMDGGQVTLDVRETAGDAGITIATPRGSLTVTEPGTYRVEIRGTATYFIARRGGRGRIQPADGADPVQLSAGAQIVLQEAGLSEARVAVDDAPALDEWDHWNDDRTDAVLASPSYAYVSRDVYGADELDRHGDWRHERSYGYVWVPRVVGPGWVPYSSGRWLWDPYYGWSWLDTAPWGWAPFHYGRWVYLGSRWGWAPGPLVLTPVYSPALVVFFGGPGWTGGFGSPFVSWVALGWGEPLVPWWGPPGFVGVPCWYGWGGPRVGHGHGHGHDGHGRPPGHYVNTRIQHAVISTPRDRFRSGATEFVRPGKVDPQRLHPLPHRELPAYAGAGREGGSRRPPAWQPQRFEAAEPIGPTKGAPAGFGTDQREHRAGTRQGSPRFPLRQTDQRERYRPGVPAPGAPTEDEGRGGVEAVPRSPYGKGGAPAVTDIERHSPRVNVPRPLPPRYGDPDGGDAPGRPGTLPHGGVHPRRPGDSGSGSSRFGDGSGDSGGPPPVTQPQVVQPSLRQPMIPGPAPLPNAPGAGGAPGRGGGIWPGGGPPNMLPGSPGQMMPAAPSGLPAVPAAPMGGRGGQQR